MNLRVHIAPDPADAPRPSAKVSTVAAMLDENEREVRRMLKAGELEGHGKGKRGVRIFLDSVRAFQERRARPVLAFPAAPGQGPRRRRAISTAAHRSAMAGLKAKGIV